MSSVVTKTGEVLTLRQLQKRCPWRTPCNHGKTGLSPSGTGKQDIYGYKKLEDGTEIYTVVGTKDLNAQIQEESKVSSIHYIVSQMAKGDNSALLRKDRSQEFYGDSSKLPHNIHELHAYRKKLEGMYEEDPIIKEIYPTKFDYINALSDTKTLIDNVNKHIEKKAKDFNEKLKNVALKQEIKKEVKPENTKAEGDK